MRAANVAILRRNGDRDALGYFDDPAVIAEARKRFAGLCRDAVQSLDKSIRGAVLNVVAVHADAKTWEQLHQLALHAKSPLEKNELFQRLGAARDPALAQKALGLVFSNEVDADQRPREHHPVSVAGEHPQMAFDFALANLQRLYVVLEPDSRAEYVPRLIAESHDDGLIAKLDAFAQDHIPASARSSVTRAEGNIRLTQALRRTRVPEIDRWIAANGE